MAEESVLRLRRISTEVLMYSTRASVSVSMSLRYSYSSLSSFKPTISSLLRTLTSRYRSISALCTASIPCSLAGLALSLLFFGFETRRSLYASLR